MSVKTKVIGMGASAMVSTYDETSVLKGYLVVHDGQVINWLTNSERSKRSLAVEHRAYERLGQHKSILQCFGWVQVQPEAHSLRLELASKGSLRSFIETTESSQVPMSARLTWALDWTGMNPLEWKSTGMSCLFVGEHGRLGRT